MAVKNNTKQKIINYSAGKNLNVRLRGKRLANGTISLYLDFYIGYSKNDAGKIITQRKVEYLKMYLTPNPKMPEERIKNDETITLAQAIRSNRESEFQHKSEGLVAPFKKKSNFFDYCDAYEKRYQKKDIRMIKLAIREFKDFTKETYLMPKQIEQVKIKGFRDHLLNKYHGETPHSVFARFKKILNAATEEGLFIKNPGDKITCKVPVGVPKAILMPDEIVALSKAKCGNSDVKRAFLLCLNTGLRFVDVTDLKYKHITNGQIKKQQQKTGREVVIDLNPTAIKLLGKVKDQEDFVFHLPTFEACLKIIRNWAERAGIKKHLTWHSARHSFATILLMNKTDIKTVSSLLGHSKLEHTQKYTHLIDALKTQAVNTLPEIDL